MIMVERHSDKLFCQGVFYYIRIIRGVYVAFSSGVCYHMEKHYISCVGGYLMEHKAEARAMSIFEYDQERHMQQEREAGIEKGERQLLRRQVQKKLAKGMNIADIAEALEETEERIREIAAEVAGEQKK